MSLDDIFKTANEIMDKMEDKDDEAAPTGAKGDSKKPVMDDDAYVVPSKAAWKNLRTAVAKLAQCMEMMAEQGLNPNADAIQLKAMFELLQIQARKIKKLVE